DKRNRLSGGVALLFVLPTVGRLNLYKSASRLALLPATKPHPPHPILLFHVSSRLQACRKAIDGSPSSLPASAHGAAQEQSGRVCVPKIRGGPATTTTEEEGQSGLIPTCSQLNVYFL
ncbi:hypothetical protein C8F01DRAFT_1375249, partial [Mycena amicta]